MMETTQLTAIDPVCGMSVNPEEEERNRQHDGKTYHFCSDSCIRKFEADPIGILKARGTSMKNVGADLKGEPSCCSSSKNANKANATREPPAARD